MIYKIVLVLGMLFVANIIAIEAEEAHHCCPKGESTCRCHHNHDHDDPHFVQVSPIKTIIPPYKAHFENIPEVHTPESPVNAIPIVDDRVVKPGPDIGLNKSLNPTSGAGIVVAMDSKVKTELPDEIFHESKVETSRPPLDDDHAKKLVPVSSASVSISKSNTSDFEVSKIKMKYFMMTTFGDEHATKARGNSLRVIIYNKGKKIEGAFDIKSEPKEAIEGDLFLLEDFENDPGQEGASFFKSWLEQLLSFKTIEINLAGFTQALHQKSRPHGHRLRDYHPQARIVDYLQIS